MSPKKRKTPKKTSKKRRKSTKRKKSRRTPRPSRSPENPESQATLDKISSDTCEYNQYEDNISLYEQENMDLLDTFEGVEYDQGAFKRNFPHLAEELGDQDATVPVDAVRWDDDDCAAEVSAPPQESSVESLLQRSRTEEEASEIILYLEKQGEITSRKASKLINKLKKKGLAAFKRRKKK